MVSCFVLFQGYVCTVSVNPEVMAWFHDLYWFSEPGGDGVVSCFVLFQ